MKKILIAKRFTALLWALVLTLMPMSLMADNTPLSATVTFEVGSFVYEQAGNAFDGKPETKWCGGILTTNNTNAYVQVQLAEKSKLDYYYLYTGNDINYKDDDSQQQRNPKEWKLYAKVNEGDEWTLISHVTDAGLPTTVCTRSNNYKIDAAYQNIEYNYLKFEILQVEQGTIFEVGEICFINCNHTFGSDDICTECGYKKQQDDGFINVATTKELWDAIKADSKAKVRLTADFALSDIDKDYELYCNGNTFYGTIDGNGHTIKGDPLAPVRARTYMFSMSDGATFKNLTFKGIRVNSDKNSNQAIITSKAQNGCVFENITFENVHTWTNDDNAGSAVGWAKNCTFSNITVKNSDFTVDDNQAGCVVGHAIDCTFTNIKVENCESTSAADFGYGSKSGGVAGRTDNCTISNVKILGSFIQTYCVYGGGVVGYAEGTQFTNCVVDDQSCVCVDGITYGSADAGGIVGYCKNCKINNCINSALIAADYDDAGGIAGSNENSDIVGCLNTGMVIDIDMDVVKESFYNKYKTKTDMTCVTKTYQGKEYVIRKYEYNEGDKEHDYFGGIVGYMPEEGNVSKCVNFGSVYCPNEFNRVCGIVGGIKDGTISDCLSDFSGGSYGICQFTPNENHCVSINNCLNLTTYKDIEPYQNKWDGCSGENNYSLTTATDAKFTTQTTADKIESGEICHLLGEAWEQNLGTDAYPAPTGSKGVYHTRTVSNEYGTVCLPFSVQSDDKISYYSLIRKEEDGQGIKLVFTYNEDRIQEGTPLLFRSAEAKDATADNPVEICFNNAGNEFANGPVGNGDGYWELWGTFEQKVFDETTSPSSKNIYYVSSGEIKNAKKVTIAPYRAYFVGPSIDELTSNGSNTARVRFVIEDEDGETAALELVGDDFLFNGRGEATYTLFGTKAGEGYRGIVIRNGKKVIQNR